MTATPASLCDLCLTYCMLHFKETLLEIVDKPNAQGIGYLYDSEMSDDPFYENILENEHIYQFKNGIYLTEECFEYFLRQSWITYGESYIKLFHDTLKCRLRRIDLSNSEIVDQKLIKGLFSHPVVEINLNGCSVDSDTLKELKICAPTLRHLRLSGSRGTLPGWGFAPLSNLKYLQTLDVSETRFGSHMSDVDMIAHLQCLTWLDLSSTQVKDIRPLALVNKTLSWLSLHNCVKLDDYFKVMKTLKKLTALTHLDMSKRFTVNDLEQPENGLPGVTRGLLQEVAKLPHLESLEISGSMGLFSVDLECLRARRKKLKFLGLLRTGLCWRGQIPAEVVTGQTSEVQVLAALEIYKRKNYNLTSLGDLFLHVTNQGCQNNAKAVEMVVKAMNRHLQNYLIQTAGSALLYWLSQRVDPINKDARRSILVAILNAMETHEHVLQLQKNCCLTICNFHIPDEVEFLCERMTNHLLSVLKYQKDNYVRTVAVTLFNAMACKNSGEHKLVVGKNGGVQIILKIICEIIEAVETEESSLLETCWSSLWNVTDETPDNCQVFMEHGGMDLFVKCLNRFRQKPQVQRNMMGLLGNVSEVPALRPLLLQDQYLKVFYDLLDPEAYDLEVNYNAGGILSHLASDGPKTWSSGLPRELCMDKLMKSVEQWNITSYRNINYRSFQPILGLLQCFETPAVQRWGTWALANLTQVYPDIYCKLLIEENGLEKLEKIKAYCLDPFSVDLAEKTLTLLTNWLERGKEFTAI